MACIHTSPPEIYRSEGLTLHDFDELGELFQEVVDDPKKAIESRRGFLLFGPTGVGKSSVVACVHHEFTRKKKLVRWFECSMLPPDPIEAEDILEELMFDTAYVVIFDDLGQEPPHHHKRVAKVLQARALMPRRLDFITTNLTLDFEDEDECEISQKYGKHVRSRMWRMCKGGIIEMNGQDHRTE